MSNKVDMTVWRGRTDPEMNSERWHQCIEPLRQSAPVGCVLAGFSSDAGVARNQGRTGAAKGPEAIRRALAPQAWHRQGPAYDAGDITCQGDALEAAQQQLGEVISPLIDAGHLPIVLGGGHEIAFGSWQGIAGHFESQGIENPKIGIINLDAHFDLRDPQYSRSSGTPFSQIAEQCQKRGWPFHYACFGVCRASNTRALFNRAHELNVMVREDREFTPAAVQSLVEDIKHFTEGCDHLYLTIDLDVFPASEAPGVSAPAARGVSFSLLEPLLEAIRDTGKLKLADLAELNPDFDIDNHTAKLAARIVHLLTLSN